MKYPFLYILVLLAILLRLPFVWQAPFTNDEGTYLYDAKVLAEGRLPTGDILTKTPVSLVLFQAAVTISDHSLLAARVVTATLSILTLWPLLYSAHVLGGRRAAEAAGLIWGLGAGPVAMYSLGQTEAVATFFAVAALACWLSVFKIDQSRRLLVYILPGLAGLSFALAFASRKTSLALIVILVVVYIFARRRQPRDVLMAIAGIVLIIGPWLVVLYRLYGLPGVAEALGVGYATTVTQRFSGGATSWGGGFLWAFEVVARVTAPLLMLGFVGLVSLSQQFAHSRYFAWLTNKVWLLSSLLAAAIASLLLYKVTTKTEYLLSLCYALCAWLIWMRGSALPHIKPLAARVVTSWLIGLSTLYLLWPTFLPDYAADFFPALTLLGATVVAKLPRAATFTRSLIVLLLISNAASLVSAYTTSWLGTFNRQALLEMAALLQQTVPAEEKIFTAAVIVPYASGHHALADLAHPYWYQYTFIDPMTKAVFLPPIENIATQVEQGCVQWAIIEHLTRYAYLTPPNAPIKRFEGDWQLHQEIKNVTSFRPNTLKLYKHQYPNQHDPACTAKAS